MKYTLLNNSQNFPGEQFPLSLKSSGGSYVLLADGRRLLDCDCNSGVFSLGHRHPAAIAALNAALGRYDMGNHHLISEPKALLADLLAGLLPRGLTRCVFNATRSEAVDVAIKLARGFSGKSIVISCEGSYHGSTGFSLAASDSRFAAAIGMKPPGFIHVPFNDLAALRQALSKNETTVAAVIIEPVEAEAGALVPDRGFLRGVRRLCDKSGALMIVDESYTGLGRCGKMFESNRESVSPDILIAGAALGGGIFPMHSTCHAERLDRFFVKNPFIHISTFGGGELGCFAAMAALKELSRPSLLKNVVKQSSAIKGALERLAAENPGIVREIRSSGLLFGAVFASEQLCARMTTLLVERNILCRRAALDKKTLLLSPPLNINDDETEELMNALDGAISALVSGGGAAPC